MGGVVEWSIAPVLKTGVAQATVGSNPTSSARSPTRFGRSGVFRLLESSFTTFTVAIRDSRMSP